MGVLEFFGKGREEKKGKSVGSDSDGSECRPKFGEKRQDVLQVVAMILYD